MLVKRRVTPSIKFAGTHLYTQMERGSVRVKWTSCSRTQRNCYSQRLNPDYLIMSPQQISLTSVFYDDFMFFNVFLFVYLYRLIMVFVSGSITFFMLDI